MMQKFCWYHNIQIGKWLKTKQLAVQLWTWGSEQTDVIFGPDCNVMEWGLLPGTLKIGHACLRSAHCTLCCRITNPTYLSRSHSILGPMFGYLLWPQKWYISVFVCTQTLISAHLKKICRPLSCMLVNLSSNETCSALKVHIVSVQGRR
jgi:hypothetical protein